MKRIFLFFFLLTIAFESEGQQVYNEGGVVFSFNQNELFYGIKYSRFINPLFAVGADINYLQSKNKESIKYDYSSFMLNLNAERILYKNLSYRLRLGGSIVQEVSRVKPKYLSEEKIYTRYGYGTRIYFKNSFIISHFLVLSFSLSQYYMRREYIPDFFWTGNIAITYLF